MTPIRSHGFTRAALAQNVVNPGFVPHLPPRTRASWRIDRNAQTVQLENAPAPLADLVFPLAPMIGCFGVAPAGGQQPVQLGFEVGGDRPHPKDREC